MSPGYLKNRHQGEDIIRVVWYNAIGNNLRQYAIGRLLSETWGVRLTFCKDVLGVCVTDPLDYLNLFGLGLDYISPTSGCKELRLDWVSTVRKYYSRELFKQNIPRIRSWFKPIKKDRRYDDDLIVHLRLGGDWEAFNRIIPFEKIEQVLSTIKFRKMYIVTDVFNHSFLTNFDQYKPRIVSKETRQCVRGETFYESPANVTVRDFNRIRKFNKVLLCSAESTFGWWAAMLGDADEVYCVQREKRPLDDWFIKEIFRKIVIK